MSSSLSRVYFVEACRETCPEAWRPQSQEETKYKRQPREATSCEVRYKVDDDDYDDEEEEEEEAAER